MCKLLTLSGTEPQYQSSTPNVPPLFLFAIHLSSPQQVLLIFPEGQVLSLLLFLKQPLSLKLPSSPHFLPGSVQPSSYATKDKKLSEGQLWIMLSFWREREVKRRVQTAYHCLLFTLRDKVRNKISIRSSYSDSSIFGCGDTSKQKKDSSNFHHLEELIIRIGVAVWGMSCFELYELCWDSMPKSHARTVIVLIVDRSVHMFCT